VFALHWQELLQGFHAALLVTREDHCLHERNAIFGEEHVLRAAESDSFGAEQACLLGVAWDIGVRANTEVPAELISPFHERCAVVRLGVRRVRLALAEVNLAERAVERNP